jgi:hypothetical protein
MNEQFVHKPAGHCESGALSTLLTNFGLPLSEPMVFGLGSGISFAFIPFVKMDALPLTAYRGFPKTIVSGVAKLLGIKLAKEKFRDKAKAEARLRELLRAGKLVVLQTSVFYLPYFPPEMQFHFNAHSILIYGEKDGRFLVSDPVFDIPQTIAPADLLKARFAEGIFAPKGFLYYPVHIPEHIDMARCITKAIRKVIRIMLYAPIPFIGIKGMFYMAKKVEALKNNKNARYVKLFLGNIVRMQEEIGTGGGGFRYLYAAFLQEAAGLHPKAELLNQASKLMTEAGDLWRDFAFQAAKFIQNKNTGDPSPLAALIRIAAAKEKEAYQPLLKI